MALMERLVREQGLVMVRDFKNAEDEAIYSGYMTKDGRTKEGWGT